METEYKIFKNKHFPAGISERRFQRGIFQNEKPEMQNTDIKHRCRNIQSLLFHGVFNGSMKHGCTHDLSCQTPTSISPEEFIVESAERP